MSEFKIAVFDPFKSILEQAKRLRANEVSLIVIESRCFFPRDICVNIAPESGWKCTRCGYDAEGFRGQILNWNFCPKCLAINQEVL